MSNLPVILLVEDEATDAYFVKWALQRTELEHRFCHVVDGQEALDYLSGSGLYGDRLRFPLPSLMLLDIKLPRLNGFDVLKWIRANSTRLKFPIIVLSSSEYPSDIELARKLGAAEYRPKPNEPNVLVALMRDICRRYLQAEPTRAKRHEPAQGVCSVASGQGK